VFYKEKKKEIIHFTLKVLNLIELIILKELAELTGLVRNSLGRDIVFNKLPNTI
jgi:hypothetical protein